MRHSDDNDENENENQTDADRRPPRAEPDSYGVRAGRTTVLHPLDNDSAPAGRLLSIVNVEQPTGGARVEISPDGQTLVTGCADGVIRLTSKTTNVSPGTTSASCGSPSSISNATGRK